MILEDELVIRPGRMRGQFDVTMRGFDGQTQWNQTMAIDDTVPFGVAVKHLVRRYYHGLADEKAKRWGA